jgi:hypothetical protein
MRWPYVSVGTPPSGRRLVEVIGAMIFPTATIAAGEVV